VGSPKRGANTGGADVGDNGEGAGLVEAGANGERHCPYQGQARSNGGICY
jgi:hypothetical protein